MSINETFSNTISLPVTNQYAKGAVMEISRVFGRFTILPVEASFETALFRYLSYNVFGVRNFKNTKFMRVIFLLKIFKI